MQRYSGSSGAFIDIIIPTSDQWRFGFNFVFGADDTIYILANGDQVLWFNGRSGGFIDTFIQADQAHLRSAIDLAFDPNGNLYFVRQDTDQVLRYQGTTGAFIDIFIDPVQDHAAGASYLVFYPKPAASTAANWDRSGLAATAITPNVIPYHLMIW